LLRQRAGVAAVAGTAPFDVRRTAVEGPVFLAAVPLGGEQRGTGRVAADGFDGTLDQEDVGFLAGFEDAELGVDRGLFRHDPVGSWIRAARTALDVQPGGPPLIRSQ